MYNGDGRRVRTISIHVPREGHDWQSIESPDQIQVFQSTCPARGTTDEIMMEFIPNLISIHVPREGHDFTYHKR